MPQYLGHLELWSENNSIDINNQKNKEMILASIQNYHPASLHVNGNVISTCIQLHIKLRPHYIFLKILKRSGLLHEDPQLNMSYAEYCCIVWQHNLISAQSDRLEAFQKRPAPINNTAPAYCHTESLKVRQEHSQKKSLTMQFVIPRTDPVTSSSLNVIPLFLSECAIQLFIPFPRHDKTLLLIH